MGRVCQLVALLLFLALTAAAQTGLDNLMSTAATTTKDALNRDWAFLSWQGTSPTLLTGRVFAVYAKAGDANSPNPYQRKAVVMLQTDPLVIQPLLQRSVNVGENLARLEQDIDNLFDQIMPAGTIGLANKISAVLRGAMNDPELFANLLLLSKLHPAISFCLGSAHAELIPGPNGAQTTFELRLYDMMKDADIAVVGRVTAIAGMPTVLPAPGRPVEVPDVSARGNINAKLRWSNPDDLRRLSLLQYGFNVYRMTRAFAEGAGYHLAPPSTAVLLSLAANHPNVHQLNQLPIVTDRNYTAASVGDFGADPETFFFSDDNRRFDPTTSLPQLVFTNGAQFYYYLTARDILGRDGGVSPGTLVRICDRMPPPAPRRPSVVNDYTYQAGNSRQKLKVLWRQNINTSNETTLNYYVYRWTSLTQMHARAGNPLSHRIAGPIPHVSGQAVGSYVDDGPGSPAIATDAGRTIWYTIRAADAGACGPNLGPNSAPVFGVLRDRVGPGRGGGSVEIECVCPEVTFVPPPMEVFDASLDTNSHHFRLVCSRSSPSIVWVDFYRLSGSPMGPVFIARRFFSGGSNDVRLDHSIPRGAGPPMSTMTFLARAGARSGKASPPVSSIPILVPTNPRVLAKVTFEAHLVRLRSTSSGDCPQHDPNPPDDGGGGKNPGIKITVFFTPTTREWKVYRRIDDGPLTLLRQGEGNFEAGQFSAAVFDDNEPANAATLCYFAQLFDEHGNAGPLQRLECIRTHGAAPVPTPMLNALTASGTADNPRMGLQWFCAPHGVERFEVWIAGKPLSPGERISADLVTTNAMGFDLLPDDLLADPDGPPRFILYRTPRLGPAFGKGPLFNVTVTNVLSGNTYFVFVKALTKDGAVGPMSNTEQFVWNTTNVLGPNVPWPDRPLPPVSKTNFPHVLARVFTTNDPVHPRRYEGVAVRIGEALVQLATQPPGNLPDFIPGNTDPVQFLYTNAQTGESLFSVAMYRHQVANPEFPTVSGDLIQVTPLMEQIAYDVTALPGVAQAAAIYDPFVRVFAENPSDPNDPRRGIYLLDTQPVVKGARYRYVLVRFKSNHEVAELLPTNEVEVPP